MSMLLGALGGSLFQELSSGEWISEGDVDVDDR